jgi:uncharacterized protein (DUF1778 family)
MFRLPRSLKRRIEDAAYRSGQSLQEFLLQAALASTNEVERRTVAHAQA